jgi:hypothetical protein
VVQCVPSQYIIAGPATGWLPAGMPPTIQPDVGLSMKIEVRFVSVKRLGLPLTTIGFQVPKPAVTVKCSTLALSPTAHPSLGPSMKTEFSDGNGIP